MLFNCPRYPIYQILIIFFRCSCFSPLGTFLKLFFEIIYSDPGHNAAGFGFVGVQGSDTREQDYLFSNPADGIVAGNTIAYPLDQGCGTGLEFTGTVKAWIYNKAGVRSKPVIIHLACRT